MSLGALSPEAHQAISIGMARLGGSANSGEGGEDPAWYAASADGDRRDAAIKQVASARFGVTAEYLARGRAARDQDRAGLEARRGRPAAGQEGDGLHRRPASRAAGHDDDQPAAAPRHLLDRGPRAAHQRPARGQPDGAHRREAGGRSGDRHDRRRRGQGARRLRDDQRPRGRHRRLATELDQARRVAVGARPGRDAPGARPQPAARPRRAAHRRRPSDRSRRRHRRHAGRRGVRVRDGRAGGDRLRHGAPVPPRHLPHRASRPSARTCAPSSPARPSRWCAFFTALAEDVRRELAALGLRSLGEAVGRADLLDGTAAAAIDLGRLVSAPAWAPASERSAEGSAAAGPTGRPTTASRPMRSTASSTGSPKARRWFALDVTTPRSQHRRTTGRRPPAPPGAEARCRTCATN